MHVVWLMPIRTLDLLDDKQKVRKGSGQKLLANARCFTLV